jgi:transcriptional regulator with XRE-family HTH domain
MKNKHLGGALDDFLEEEGVLEEVTLVAKKRAMALQLEAALKATKITKAELAHRMGTSRAQVDRLLDPENESVTLKSLFRVGSELGLELEVKFVPHRRARHAQPRRGAMPRAARGRRGASR